MNKGEGRTRSVLKLNTTSMAKLVVLDLLIKHEYYGNEIIHDLYEIFHYTWKPSPGLIYPLLRDMEDNGWIKGWWMEPDKKTIRKYKITDEGIKYYNRIKLTYKTLIDDNILFLKSILNQVYINKKI